MQGKAPGKGRKGISMAQLRAGIVNLKLTPPLSPANEKSFLAVKQLFSFSYPSENRHIQPPILVLNLFLPTWRPPPLPPLSPLYVMSVPGHRCRRQW